MPGDEDSVSGEIKTPIALVIGGVAKKNIEGGPRCEFVRHRRGKVGVASTTKHAEVCIGGMGAIEMKVGRSKV